MKASRFIVSLLLALPAGLAWADKPTPVTVTNTPLPVTVSGTVSGSTSITGTVDVRNVDNPDRQPLQAVICDFGNLGVSGAPTCGSLFQTFSVPAGKRLVIEFLSGSCMMSANIGFNMSFSTTVNGTTASMPLLFTRNAFDSRFAGLAQSTRLYADPGTVVGITSSSVGTLDGNPAFVQCTVNVSGYLVTP
jgi:hypothetical protein